MQMAGGAGAGRSLVTAIQKGLVTTFSVCFCSGGLSFGRKSLQGTLVTVRARAGQGKGREGNGGKIPANKEPPKPAELLGRAGAEGPPSGRGSWR